ncbi:hypothetical protein ACFVFS_08625 [Kitasatospora sp. NPDC057692]|uniref:hypothetical protein n=1 Tax=Kitasatospora sp. NPDC057692 TaxID=3346215 RepID=UPI00367A15C3
MATDAWGAVRDGVTALVHRRSPGSRADIEARLDASAALVARGPDADRARELVVGQWRLELEAFLAAHPAAFEELQEELARLQAALPAARQQWVQHNVSRDHSTLNVVQHGTQYNQYMDSAGTRPPTGPVGPGTES